MTGSDAGLVVWDVDGTLIPADLRWLRRAISRTYDLAEDEVAFPQSKVHGYTDESITIDTAINSGVDPDTAMARIEVFQQVLMNVMHAGRAELQREQAAYAGAAETLDIFARGGFTQTVLTGNIRPAAEFKLEATDLDQNINFGIGAFGSDSRDRMALPELVFERYTAQFGKFLDRKRTVLIGDAPNDVLCARQGGFYVITVAHRGNRDELVASGPDVVVDELDPQQVYAAARDLVTG